MSLRRDNWDKLRRSQRASAPLSTHDLRRIRAERLLEWRRLHGVPVNRPLPRELEGYSP